MIDTWNIIVKWLCAQACSNRAISRSNLPSRLAFPLLGLTFSLLVGCSTFSSHQPTASLETAHLKGKAGVVTQDVVRNSRRVPPMGQSKSDLAIPEHPSIDAWTITYTERKRQSFQSLLGRAEAYVLPVQRIFSQEGVPTDLVYVALVESGFTPTARSSADAVGMWQFISSTGERFGLEQNKWVDERRDPFKSAQAAARYLSALYDQFGSWSLALAAYNAGENGVQRALDESGLSTFWELREHGYLPLETQDYVPKVFAAIRISRNSMQYGFHFKPRQDLPQHETVSVPGGVKLAWLGKKIGVEESTLQAHNPELCSTITPPGAPCYELCVPAGTKESVLAALTEPRPSDEKPETSSPKHQRTAQTIAEKPPGRKTDASSGAKKSKKGPSMAQLATPKQGLTRSSGAPKDAGVPKKDTPAKVTASISNTKKKEPAGSAQAKAKTFWYATRHGDTLQSVAERFRIPVDTLASDNQIPRNQKLIPGKVLTICTQERTVLRPEKRGAN